MIIESDFDVEEKEYEEGNEPSIIRPYNPELVDVVSQPMTIRTIFDRIEHDEIDLMPSFQRNGGLWDITKKSRLIESILIKIPLPMFYFDSRDEEKWTIVDGLQRISTLNEFVLQKKWSLHNLEYLKNYEGLTYDQLSRSMQRRIQECQILSYCIRKGTPDDVTSSIFKRLNTGGLTLKPAEIRNSVYRGIAAVLVKKMAELESFKAATRNRVSPNRMDDRDLATRFLAFYILGYQKYTGNMETFLEDGMSYIKEEGSQMLAGSVLNAFDESMKCCRDLLGDKAFRKKQLKGGNFGPINKSLFECTSCCIGTLNDDVREELVRKKELFFASYEKLFEGKFYAAVNSATGSMEHVQARYTLMYQLINNILEG